MGIVFHWRTQKNKAALGETAVNSIQNFIDYPVPLGLLQLGPGAHVRHDMDIRPGPLDAPGDRAADEPQADECNGFVCHLFHEKSP